MSTVGVVFVGRLVCPVNILYMELSYTAGFSLKRVSEALRLADELKRLSEGR